MDDILFSDSNADTLERMFEEVKKGYLNRDYKLFLKNKQMGDSVNYLGYKIGLQKIRTQRHKLGKTNCRLLMTFKDCLGDISSLQRVVGITPDLIIYLNKTLDSDKDLNTPMELTAEAEKELTVIEEKL